MVVSPRARSSPSTFFSCRAQRSDCHVSSRVVARPTRIKSAPAGALDDARRRLGRGASEARGAVGEMSALANTSAARSATSAVALGARRRRPDLRGPAPGTARRREVAVATRRRGAGATARATGDADPSGARTPPPGHMCFEVTKTLRVPVPEPPPVRLADGASPRSLERWIDAPENVMGVVFTSDGIERLATDLWRVCVVRLPLLDWELNPEFDLRILGREGARRPGAIRMRSTRLRLAGDASAERLPPGFADMSIWSHIDAELYVARGTEGVDGGGAVRGTTAVCADLSIRIAADIPGALRVVPFFKEIGETAVAASLDVVGSGAQDRVQEAYEAWATDEEGGERVERGGLSEEDVRVVANAAANTRG